MGKENRLYSISLGVASFAGWFGRCRNCFISCNVQAISSFLVHHFFVGLEIIKPGFRKRGGILKQRRHPTVNFQNRFALSQSNSLSSSGNCKLSWLSVDRFDSCDLATGSCPEFLETSSRR